jgi:hypothetical protein
VARLTYVKDAVRSLRTTPGTTGAAFVILTLAIGASIAIFTVADNVVLRGLPFRDSDEIVALGSPSPRGEPTNETAQRRRWR